MEILKPTANIVPHMPAIPGLFPYVAQRVAGEYYGIMGASITSSSVAVVADKIYSAPFLVLQEETFDRIAINIGTGAVGAARLGIYASASNSKPGALVLDAGEIADTSTTGDKEIVIDQTLTPGLYWVVSVFSGTPSVISAANIIHILGLPGTIATGGNSLGSYTGMAYGALPASHPTFASTSRGIPAVCLRRA